MKRSRTTNLQEINEYELLADRNQNISLPIPRGLRSAWVIISQLRFNFTRWRSDEEEQDGEVENPLSAAAKLLPAPAAVC